MGNERSTFDTGSAESLDEKRAFAEVLAVSLRFPSLDKDDWLSRYDEADFWLARRGGEVVGGADRRVTLDICGLAPLCTGALPAERLAAMRLLAGRDEDLATATSLFAGPAPWMPGIF